MVLVASPGTYALIMKSPAAARVTIGKLGVLSLLPGRYLYVGSAQGPGGLKARVGHHLGRASRPRWHVDYIRRVLPIVEVWYSADPARLEHAWAEILNGLDGVSIAGQGFGSSDCRCASHLFYTRKHPSIEGFRERAGAALSGRAPIQAVHL